MPTHPLAALNASNAEAATKMETAGMEMMQQEMDRQEREDERNRAEAAVGDIALTLSTPVAATSSDQIRINLRDESPAVGSPGASPSSLSLVRQNSESTNRTGAATAKPNNRRLSKQLARNAKLTESWPGSHHLRRLFRLFDRDGNGTITHSEFRTGLASIGFDVSNVAQVKALQQEVDIDHTGLIRERSITSARRTMSCKVARWLTVLLLHVVFFW